MAAEAVARVRGARYYWNTADEDGKNDGCGRCFMCRVRLMLCCSAPALVCLVCFVGSIRVVVVRCSLVDEGIVLHSGTAVASAAGLTSGVVGRRTLTLYCLKGKELFFCFVFCGVLFSACWGPPLSALPIVTVWTLRSTSFLVSRWLLPQLLLLLLSC